MLQHCGRKGCDHKAQDTLHGKNIRVFNATVRKARDGMVVVRCSVCEHEREVKK